MGPQFGALTYKLRLDVLRATKLEHARRKVELTGPRDAGEKGNAPPRSEVAAAESRSHPVRSRGARPHPEMTGLNLFW